jgi:hypothetical protein
MGTGMKGCKGVLLTTHANYVPRSTDVDLYIRVPNTSFVASCLTNLSTGAHVNLYLLQNLALEPMGIVTVFILVKIVLTLEERVPEFSDTVYIRIKTKL